MITKVIYNFNDADAQLRNKNVEQDTALNAKLNQNLGLPNANRILVTDAAGQIVAIDNGSGGSMEYRDYIGLNSMTEGSTKQFVLGIADDGSLSVYQVVPE